MMMIWHQCIGIVSVLILTLLATAMPASASLIGDEIDITFSTTDPSGGTSPQTLNNVTVGAGIEASADFLLSLALVLGNSELIDLDISSGGISIDFTNDSYVNASNEPVTNMRFLFENLDWLPDPGVIIDATFNETVLNFDVAVMTTANSVQVDFTRLPGAGPLDFDILGSVDITLQTIHIDEPAALGVFAIGLLGLALARRRGRARLTGTEVA